MESCQAWDHRKPDLGLSGTVALAAASRNDAPVLEEGRGAPRLPGGQKRVPAGGASLNWRVYLPLLRPLSS